MTPRQSFHESRMQRQEPAQRDSHVVVHEINAGQFTSFGDYGCSCRESASATCEHPMGLPRMHRAKSAWTRSWRVGALAPGCHQADPLALTVPHKAHRIGEVTVVIHHDRAVEKVQSAIVQEMNGKVDIRTFLLGSGAVDCAAVPRRSGQGMRTAWLRKCQKCTSTSARKRCTARKYASRRPPRHQAGIRG